jgi:hypothetical protein
MEMTEHGSETVTVIDPRHPLCGQSFRLLGIAMKNQLGRCCVVLDHAGRERNLPIAVTDHSPDLLTISPLPLTITTITSLIHVYSHICPPPTKNWASRIFSERRNWKASTSVVQMPLDSDI